MILNSNSRYPPSITNSHTRKTSSKPITFGYVEIEEVAIENRLNTASNNNNGVKEALHVISIDPVANVEGAIDAEGEKVVAGYRLRLSRLGDHEQLRKNCDRLQVDGKRPKYLKFNTNIQSSSILCAAD